MRRFLFVCLLALATQAFAQNKIAALTTAEYEAGHFNGTLLAVRNGRVVSQVNRGSANFQFGVPIDADTRFPIASMTKLFTAILVLQLVEKGQLKLDDRAASYLPDLPVACRAITIRELLTHTSGLKNEPVKAYQAAYSTAEFVRNFVAKDSTKQVAAFNYNNVDYIVLTRVLEMVTKKPFAAVVQAAILTPLQMHDSGVIAEARIIPRLAYGYHNYTFGNGSAKDTLRNDRRYLANYAGAGALYSTTADLYKLVQGLKAHTLLSAKTSAEYLLKPQQANFLDYARGYPTIGFFYNDKMVAHPILERRGSIDGFNSVLLTDKDFTKVVIILTNTDQADLEKFGDKVYNAF
ncbi:serine hydrolase [Hymenobacter sp. RP-2-7]|uniref:Serine hydrolase n=1 Tax=Hymenobacter polaris TaxID=2682546 RepID=A0A7Y0AFJ1_9BACT|nr:serine hydrolase [Hymenobacter polaris]NML66242.1 serine hydrolase [Hymenobacter polaris]